MPSIDGQFQSLLKALPAIDDPRILCEAVYSMLEMMLRRDGDRPLLTELSEVVGQIIGDIPFDADPDEFKAAMRKAAHACVRVLQTAKAKRIPARGGDTPGSGKGEQPPKDVEYWLPPHLAHLLAHIEYVVPELPPAQTFGTFDELCLAAIYARMDKVLVFFQRHNSTIRRELPASFLFSAEFAAKLKRAVAHFIYPYIRDSRQVRIYSTNLDLSKFDSWTFWDVVDDALKAKLLATWQAAWDDLRLIEAGCESDTRILQIKEKTKLLRDILQPFSSDAYDLPRIGNREIDLFSSLVNTEADWWQILNAEWQRFHDFYEQEKDPRVFQWRSREGVLRDNLLAAAGRFPEQWGDFLVLLCHRVLPRITTDFLERYTANLGLTESERERRAPYLMRYLAQVQGRPDIKEREQREAAEWEAQITQLRQYLKGFA